MACISHSCDRGDPVAGITHPISAAGSKKSDTETKDSTNEAIPNLECPILTSAKQPVYLRIEDAERYSAECVEGVFSEVGLIYRRWPYQCYRLLAQPYR